MNPPASRAPDRQGSEDPQLWVSEIFLSIQGESTFAGFPCAMIRAAGCSLSCRYCDTGFARTRDQARPMELQAIVAQVGRFGVRHVELTGGEPLEQPASQILLSRLCDAQHQVLLETSGAEAIDRVDPRVHIVMDVKCPGSGMEDRQNKSNFSYLKRKDQVKFVLCDRQDYAFARRIIRDHRLIGRCPVLLSPAEGRLAARDLADWMLADRLEARLQLQLHRWLWPEQARGV